MLMERNKAIMRWVFQSLPRESIALPRPAEFIGKEERGGEGEGMFPSAIGAFTGSRQASINCVRCH